MHFHRPGLPNEGVHRFTARLASLLLHVAASVAGLLAVAARACAHGRRGDIGRTADGRGRHGHENAFLEA